MVSKIHITLDMPEEFKRYDDDWVRMRLNEILGHSGLDLPHVDRAGDVVVCEVTSVTTTRTT